jgi:hypothetical protein
METPGVVREEENTRPVVVLGVVWNFFLEFLLRVPESPIVGRIRFLSFRQPAVGACWGGRCVPLLGTLLVQVFVPAPQTARRLFTICPYVAKLLAVVALRKGILVPIRLQPDSNVAEAWQMENFPRFCSPRLWTPREVTDGWLSSV